MFNTAKPETPQETRLVMLYPWMTQEHLDYWRARNELGDPTPMMSLLHTPMMSLLHTLGRLNPLH